MRNSEEGFEANPGIMSEEKLKLLEFSIDNISDAVYWVTLDGRFWNVNAAACKMLGYSREELLSMSVHDIDPTYDPADAQSDFEKVKQTGSIRLARFHNTRDGRVIPVEIRSNYFTFNGIEYLCAVARDTSERVKAEKEAAFFRTLIEHTSDPVYVSDFKNPIRMSYVNEAACLHFAMDREQVLSMRIPDWDPEFDVEHLDKACEELKKKRSVRVETLHRVASGNLVPVELTANYVVIDGEEMIAGNFHDISKRKRAEEALRESEEKFRVLAETSPAAIIVYQEEKNVYINPYATRLIGYTEREFLEMRFWDWMHPDFKELVKERGLARQRGEPVPSQYEFKYLTKNGEEKWIFVSGGRIEYKGKPAGIATLFDITDRKRMEDELQRANDELEKRVEERTLALRNANELLQHEINERKRTEEQLKQQKKMLEDLNSTLEKRVHEEVSKNREKDIMLIQQNRQAALGELLDHIAHQWKQPLNSISLIIQNLKESWSCGDLTDESVEEAVGNTMALVQHMAQTIVVFRNFYRPEKEQVVFRLKDSIDSALSFMAPALRFHGIGVEIDADPDLSAIGYPNEYAQVLLNILTNARDAFNERKVDKPVLKIEAFAENDKAVVAITDNAGGIPESIIGKIFDLYFTTRESKDGTGIGLYMSKNIIEKNMGGKLSAANVDSGTQFRIEINMPGC